MSWGAFTRASDVGGEHLRHHVAAVDTATGRLLPWHSRINGTPLAVSRYRDQLFVGGDFTRAGGVAVSGLARLSTVTGRVARSFRPRVNAKVRALASTRHAVYVGGDFTRMNRAKRPHLAALTRSGRSLLPWRPRADAPVAVLRVHGRSVYAGGGFATINGEHLGHLVALRRGGAGRMQASFHPNIRHWVWSLTFAEGRVVVAEGGPGGTLFLLDPQGRTIWTRTFDGDVQAVAVMGRRIYAGGHWNNICSTNRVAATHGNCLDGATDRPRLASYTMAGGELTTWSPPPGQPQRACDLQAQSDPHRGGRLREFPGRDGRPAQLRALRLLTSLPIAPAQA